MSAILVADDDPHILDVVAHALERAGHAVSRASDGDEALMRARTEAPDLIVLDVGMPRRDGLDVCRTLRAEGVGDGRNGPPILFLSARDEEVDRILGLEMGGDDYVTKPFSPRELTARVAAILRRAAGPADTEPQPLAHGAVLYDPARARVACDGRDVTLTALELALLGALMARPGVVLTRERIIDTAYDGIHVSDRTVDSHVRNLRAKFAAAGSTDVIETVPRLGFRLGPCTVAG